ncbi:MAG: chitobiase/beta-hexosaminidase C-terminal domain-containing protein, partial [Gammaproteobacteria bacterium]|nr:chitobiase/beta-hexosaminidase C-terminal domain-containing protein [Gammaproteobacteria bacterium]
TESVKTEIYVIDTVVPTTTASPAGGIYADVQSVSLSCDDGDGSGCDKVYYTTDASDPGTSSDVYSSAISIDASTTLKYFAVDRAGNSGEIKTETYVIDTLAPTTTASPAGGAYSQPQSVTLSCNDGDGVGCAATYYTTDNSEPSTASTPYVSAIDISTKTTIKFFSVDKLGLAESVQSATYTIDAIPPTVSASQPTGTYLSQISVELICNDTGGAGCDKTYYTTDGTDPTTSSSLYAVPLVINIDTTLKYFAKDRAGNTSNVIQTTYKFRPSVGALYLSNGQNWNDYVKNDGVDQLHASDTACLPADAGCIHSGELRVFEVPSGDCGGLDAVDFHNVFQWRCVKEGGKAYFVTAGFKRNRHLSSLINWSLLTPDWIDNSVTVTKGTEYQFQTVSSKWWANPVEEMASSNMNTSGTVYVISSDIAEDKFVSADRIALVIKPGVTLSASVDINAVISAIGVNFLWMEGTIDAATQEFGVDIAGNYNVLRDLNVANANISGIRVSSSQWN